MVLTAIPVGFVAGLFGIGGGLITVPFLYYIFGQLGIDQIYIMHLAVGTSFAIIIPTSTVSVLTHHKFNAVDFNIVKNYLKEDLSIYHVDLYRLSSFQEFIDLDLPLFEEKTLFFVEWSNQLPNTNLSNWTIIDIDIIDDSTRKIRF